MHRGDYEQRQTERQQELARLQAQNANLRRQGAAIEGQMAQEQAKLDALQTRIDAAGLELDKMRRAIQEGKVKNLAARRKWRPWRSAGPSCSKSCNTCGPSRI